MEELKIDGEWIRLDAILKIVFNISGGEAKHIIQDGQVQLNKKVCTERSKKIKSKDLVEFNGILVKII